MRGGDRRTELARRKESRDFERTEDSILLGDVEAEDNVKGYLEEGLLKKVGMPESNILKVLRSNSEESLKVADLVYREDYSYLWAVVCAYYSMYYIANAVLYSMGYQYFLSWYSSNLADIRGQAPF